MLIDTRPARTNLYVNPKNDEPAESRYVASEISERVHARAW